MISKLLFTLERGLHAMRMNSRLLMVGILVFVFPFIFLWITQNFFTTAYENINTAEKNRLSTLHDSLRVIVEETRQFEDVFQTIAVTVAEENPDITKIRLVRETTEGYLVVSALNQDIIGEFEEVDDLYRILPIDSSETSLINESTINGVRTWQAFRGVEKDSADYIIFTEQTFEEVDAVMLDRRQNSYVGLSAVFIFLFGLAYWINRQVHWERNHHQLVNQLKERDLFSNMIAHEFRSPLTAIKGYASFLEESKNLEQEEVRFASNIRVSAERLVLLVNDFLEVARLQSGRMQIEKTDADLREVLTRVVDDLQVMAEEKGLGLRYEQPVQPIPFKTDSGRMTQVLTNLVTNSIKYTSTGAVELECTQLGHTVTIRIKDTGMGISAEDQKKLFAPFMRVGGVDQTTTTGTGLGMWITKQLVELLGGSIGVESIKGVGTHVVVTFTD